MSPRDVPPVPYGGVLLDYREPAAGGRSGIAFSGMSFGLCASRFQRVGCHQFSFLGGVFGNLWSLLVYTIVASIHLSEMACNSCFLGFAFLSRGDVGVSSFSSLRGR